MPFIRKSVRTAFLFVLLLAVVLNISIHGWAFDETIPREYKLNADYLKDFFSDFLSVVVAPAHWGGSDWARFGATMGGGAVVYVFDEDIRDYVLRNKTAASDAVFDVFARFGSGAFLVVMVGSLYAAGEVFENRALRKTALLSLEGWLFSGFYTLIFKHSIGRARPWTGKGKSSFNPFHWDSAYFAFPSGHAATVFAAATVAAAQVDNVFFDFFVYTAASLASFARIYEDAHWSSEVLVGASIGHFVAKKLLSLDKKAGKEKVQLSFHLSPYVQAVSLNFSF
jgi:membrane-associated phospholipid phosphatase